MANVTGSTDLGYTTWIDPVIAAGVILDPLRDHSEATMECSMSASLVIFADGSYDASARAGGWAFVVLEDDRQIHAASGSEAGETNNSFEVIAVVKALLWLESDTQTRNAILQTDSAHVVEGWHRWLAIWRNNGWRRVNPNQRSRRRQIPDAVLWQQLDALRKRNPLVSIELCKGHSGIAGNDRADLLARQAAHMA